MRWGWCHPARPPHSHLPWSLHHTSRRRLPCSCGDGKRRPAEQTFQPLVLRAQLQPRPNSTTICAIKPRVLRPASALILNIFFCFSAVHYLLTEKEKCYSHLSPFVFLPMLYRYLDFSFEGVNNLKLSARMVIWIINFWKVSLQKICKTESFEILLNSSHAVH